MKTVSERRTARGELSATGKRHFLIRLAAVMVGGMFLDGYILGIIGPVAATMMGDLRLTSLEEGLVAAAALLGILVGSPIGGYAADKFGRKPLFMLDMGLFVIASALQFVVDSAEWLIVVRLMMGVAIGAEYSVGWPLMSEFAPARLRGRVLGLTLIAWYSGFMAAFALGYVLTEYTDLGWRTILGTSTVIAGVLFVSRLGLPESPRWLWNVGRRDEARLVARRYLESEADVADVEHEDVRPGTFGMLFSRKYWRSTLFVSMFWFCAVSPYFAIATFADSVLESYGLGGGLAGGVGLSAVALSGVVLTVFLIDKVGRRVLTVPPQWLATVILAVIGLWAGAPPFAVLVLFLVFSFFNAMYNTLTGVYPGEVFPTEIRGIGTGFAAAVSRVGAGIGTFLLPMSMKTLGTGGTMLIAAGVALLGAVLSQWLAPETKGKSLTETAAGYGH
ncbi:MFS transporter [Sinomonas sp. P10A9]|uniref:MFS transporter n=1 Tax=Sinomonas puerhi TaxID=3238584 RepID=A0AB39L5A3_9MICC